MGIFTSYFKSNRTHTTIWFKYDHFGFSYITHFLAPIYILDFQPFKTTLEKTKGWGYGKKNHIEPNKIILTRWVNKALNQSLTKHNIIKSRLKVMVIWPFNCLKTMDNICLDP